jgi:hypothetical protein
LIDLAESLGSSRLDQTGRLTPAPAFTEVRQRLLESTSTSPLILWAKQLIDYRPPDQ